ncbi:Oidioi.mRNA.OKI2018_I69.chr1.g2333.t1.cds [Oikopleura dioica]|uniref:Oidioi.mRNA.OKI2018_I69.chr1.g2333.t1.cds n=1 Tax=Oikopleura dioica TaxID=34765 RepID=A0ABN7SQR7_OIKDI|nr:Oidioi.mRNA.OKI2018_I69.chr1.g2333.t1.cds [Oikopleura dioica]
MRLREISVLLLAAKVDGFAYYDTYEDYSELIGSVGENETYIKTVDLSEGLDRSFAARADLYDLPEAVKSGEITLDDLLAETGFDLKLSEEDRFQKLRQFRRLYTFYLVGYRLRPAHLVQYGCWCFPRGQLIMGYGQPIDNIDATCRNHQLCLNCVGLDTNYECNPHTQPYRVYGQIYQNGRRLMCKDPPGSCAWLACQCDVNMVTTSIIESLKGYKPRYWMYDPRRCTGYDQQHEMPPDQCCGKYPERFPYHSTERSCCAGKTYNPDYKECCASEDVRNLGEC